MPEAVQVQADPEKRYIISMIYIRERTVRLKSHGLRNG